MSSETASKSTDWWSCGMESLNCPRCGSNGDEEMGNMFLLIPAEILRAMGCKIPISIVHHVVLCYSCAVEIAAASGMQYLVSRIHDFTKGIGHRGDALRA